MNLVFASGFLLPQRLLGINYFRGLEDHLAQTGVKALFPQVPSTAHSDVRAGILADAIQRAYPDGPIHIIAHSMGGLDSRIVIDRNLQGLSNPGRIASLTTLSTPHRGSPIADLLRGLRPDDERHPLFEGISQALRLLGIDNGALDELTTKAALAMPDVAQTHQHIRYRSFFASGRPGPQPTSIALKPMHKYILTVTGQENDGLVAKDSAKYGEFQQPFWPCDHTDMVGHNLDIVDLGFFQFDHLAHFDAVISQL